MNEILFAGSIPNHIKNKAFLILDDNQNFLKDGWKKIRGLKTYFSYRLNKKYRILRQKKGGVLICNHSLYEKEIKNLKQRGIV